jgi:hypothetical protein
MLLETLIGNPFARRPAISSGGRSLNAKNVTEKPRLRLPTNVPHKKGDVHEMSHSNVACESSEKGVTFGKWKRQIIATCIRIPGRRSDIV